MDADECILSTKDHLCEQANAAETPSTLILSQTICGPLKQSRLLFPSPTSSSSVPLTTCQEDTPTFSPPNSVSSNKSPPLSLHTQNSTSLQMELPNHTHTDKDQDTPTDKDQDEGSQKMEIGESVDMRCNVTQPLLSNHTATTLNPSTSIVRKTRKEREALRLQREQLKAIAEALREEERCKKDEERLKREENRLKRELEKKARRECRELEERARQEKREAKEREKRERLQKKEMERQRKDEDERRKKEEKRKMELEKQQSVEVKIRKQHKEQELFVNYFSKPTKNATTQNNDVPMDLKNGCSFDANHFDKIVHDQLPVTPSYLIECRKTIIRHGNHPNHVESDDDVVIMSSPNGPPRPRMKLFQFHNNIRPPYFGSWQKKSNIVCGRNPFQKDKSKLDYEFDSDDEWEEEEDPGESVSSASEVDDDSDRGEDSAEEEDGFFVPHGYLSEDEGERSGPEESGREGPSGPEMDKVRAKAKAWEAEFQRTCHTKKAVCIGCVWLCASEEEERGKMTDEVTFLAQFSALILTETAPVKVEPTPSIISLPDTHGTTSVAIDSMKRPVPEDAMPDLIRLVHHSTIGLVKLIKTFQTHWGTVLQQQRTSKDHQIIGSKQSTISELSPPTQGAEMKEGERENKSGISKRQLERKIQQIAIKEIRPPSTKNTWYVHHSVLRQYNMNSTQMTPLSLLPPTPKSTLTSTKEISCSPEAPLSTPVGKRGVKRKTAGNTPSVKTLFEKVIAKSPQNIALTTPEQKRLKLTPSPQVRGGMSKTDEGVQPPKKRICLESVALDSQLPLRQDSASGEGGVGGDMCASGAHGNSVIVINSDSSSDSVSVVTHTNHTTTKTHSKTDTSAITPSRKTKLSFQTSSPSNPSTKPLQASPSISPQHSSCSENITTAVNATASTKNTINKCLKELTNSQQGVGGALGVVGGEGGVVVENKQCIDWQELNETTQKNSNRITVFAEIH